MSHKVTNGIIGNVLNYYCICLINAQEKKNRNLGKSRSTLHQVKLSQPEKVEKIRDDQAVVNLMVKLNLGKLDGNVLQKNMLLHIHDNMKKNINNTFISLNQYA